jgi:hypothetical protein
MIIAVPLAPEHPLATAAPLTPPAATSAAAPRAKESEPSFTSLLEALLAAGVIPAAVPTPLPSSTPTAPQASVKANVIAGQPGPAGQGEKAPPPAAEGQGKKQPSLDPAAQGQQTPGFPGLPVPDPAQQDGGGRILPDQPGAESTKEPALSASLSAREAAAELPDFQQRAGPPSAAPATPAANGAIAPLDSFLFAGAGWAPRTEREGSPSSSESRPPLAESFRFLAASASPQQVTQAPAREDAQQAPTVEEPEPPPGKPRERLSAEPPVHAAQVADAAAGPARPEAAKPEASAPPVHEQLAHGVVSHARLLERGGGADFVVELHPPELGKVHIHLQSTHEGLTARLLVAEDGARALVEGQIEQLRQRLNESAVPVVRFTVGDMTGGWQQHSQQRNRQQPGQNAPWPVAEPAPRPAPASRSSDGLDVVA